MLLDVGVVVLFGGYSVIGWAMVPGTWRGEVPDVERVVGQWSRLRFQFARSRTCLVRLLAVNALLLTYLGVRLHDRVGGTAAYLAGGVGLVLFTALLLLWVAVAASGRPRSLVPPHLRDGRESAT